MRWLAGVSVVLGLCAFDAPARAQPEATSESAPPVADEREEEARAIFVAGRSAYADGRFEQALAYFERAHEISGHPELLYNIGTCAERLGRPQLAIDSFEAYLAALPDAGNRGVVETRLAVLRRSGGSGGSTTEGGGSVDPAPWALVGTGAALAIGGAVMLGLGAVAVDRVASAADGEPWSEYEGDHELGPILGNVGIGVGAAGLALVTIGIVLAASGSGEERDAAQLRVGPGGVSLRGAF